MNVAAIVIVSWLATQGCGPACAAGELASLSMESDLDPCQSDRMGMGLPSWIGSRRKRAQAFHCNLNGQLNLIQTELEEFGVKDRLYTTTDPIEAARLFYSSFEMPGHALPRSRAAYAKEWYNWIISLPK